MQSKRVLVVDDEVNVATVLAASLESLGDEFEVDTAYSGDEALRKVQQTHYTLVLTDYKMPGMTGIDLAQAIRKVSPDTQVVLMTAYGTSDLRKMMEQMNYDYIDKPFSMAQIREIVERAVNRTREGADPYRAGEREVVQDVYEHLAALQENTSARCVLLLSAGGYPVEVAGQTEGLDISVIGALVAANFMAAAELAKQFGSGSIFKSSYHEGTDYNIYAYDLTGDLLLAVIFDSRSRPGVVWFYTKQVAADLMPLVENPDEGATEEFADALASAVDEGWEALAGGEEEDVAGAAVSERPVPPRVEGEGSDQLMSFEEAVAQGLLPPDFFGELEGGDEHEGPQ